MAKGDKKMNVLQDQVEDSQRVQLEADLAARVEWLFRRCPVLCGFSVQASAQLTRERAAGHLDGDLFLSDVSWSSRLDREQTALLVDEIAHALLELVDEQPEVAELLRGRTFARILH